MTRHEREAAERFEALVAHPYAASIAFYLAFAGAEKGRTPWGEELVRSANDIVTGRVRARGRA